MIGVLMSVVTPVVSVDWFVISKLLCGLRDELICYDVSLRRLDLDVDIASVIGTYSLLIASTIDNSFRCIIWDGINRMTCIFRVRHGIGSNMILGYSGNGEFNIINFNKWH